MKPILFNTEMVRAIQDGRKTVTRRPIKPQPRAIYHDGKLYKERGKCFVVVEDNRGGLARISLQYQPGEILYVRETFCGWALPYGEIRYTYKATDPNGNKAPTGPEYDDEWEVRPWRPSIHMPKEAARIFLRVTGVRPEQLRDMTEESAKAEGFADREQAIKAILAVYPDFIEDSWFWVNGFDRISEKDIDKAAL